MIRRPEDYVTNRIILIAQSKNEILTSKYQTQIIRLSIPTKFNNLSQNRFKNKSI